jgi:small-conductance mechanosensitive channel
LRCFAPNDVWLQVRSDLRRRIVEEFQQQGLELAVPVQKTLYPDQAVEENVPAAALSSERA